MTSLSATDQFPYFPLITLGSIHMIPNVSFLKLTCILVASIITLHQSNFPIRRIEYIIQDTILLVNITFVGYNPCAISTRSSPFILIYKEMLSFKM
jgi:hypothetical protein